MSTPSTYYPSKIEFKPLKNKIYLLTWQQHSTSRQKLMTKAMCLKEANNINLHKSLRDALTEAFKAGIIE